MTVTMTMTGFGNRDYFGRPVAINYMTQDFVLHFMIAKLFCY